MFLEVKLQSEKACKFFKAFDNMLNFPTIKRFITLNYDLAVMGYYHISATMLDVGEGHLLI